jgi:hypothetical protein
MTRTRLPDRRPNTTIRVSWAQASGATRDVLVTVGWDGRHIREVFTADFKAGSDHVGIVTDTCILISQLLQRGCTLDEMVDSMCEPPSLIGTIIKAMVEEQK